MLVHRHPIFQKVIIGVFVWGMLIFGIHVANGQMQFPGADQMGPPAGIPNFSFPSDLPRPPEMPSFSIPPAGTPPSGGPSAEQIACQASCGTAKATCYKDVIGTDNDQARACDAAFATCQQSCGGPANGGVERPGGIPTNMPNFGGQGGMPDQSKIDEMMRKGDEMRKAGEAEGLKRIKKGAQGVQKSLKMLVARVNATKAKGVTISESLDKAIVDAQAAYDALQAATDLDVAQGELEKLQAAMEVFAEEIPKLEMAANLPKILTQVEKQYTKLATAVKKQRSKLSKVAVVLADKITELDTTVAGIRSAIDAAKVKGVDPQDAMESLQNDAFDKFEGAWQLYGSLEAMRAIKTTMKAITTQMKANERLVVRLEKQGLEEAPALRSIFAKLKDKAGNLTTLTAVFRDGAGNTSSTTDLDAVFDELQNFADLQQEFEDTLMLSQDDGDVTNDKLGTANNWGVPQFAPPSGLPGSGVTDEKSLKMMQNMAGFMPKHAN